MPIYVSLLRGINVGGNKKIRMADLRALYGELGFEDVVSLLQSGNVVFKSDLTDVNDIARQIEDSIESAHGFHTDLFVLPADAFISAHQANPFSNEAEYDPKKVLVAFLSESPSEEDVTLLFENHQGPETIKIIDNVSYIYFPEGMGRSKLNPTTMFNGISATGRNLNTMNKLRAILEQKQ